MLNHISFKEILYLIEFWQDSADSKNSSSVIRIWPIGMFCAVKSPYFYLEIKKEKS